MKSLILFCLTVPLLTQAAYAQTGDLPQAGDQLTSLPGQPLCASLDELVLYLRSELGIDHGSRGFKSCGAMPEGVDFTILEVSADDPELPVRPAKIRVDAPNGHSSVTGWTVLVAEEK